MLSSFLAAGQQLSVAVREAVAALDDDLVYCLQEQRPTAQSNVVAKSRDQSTNTSGLPGSHQNRRQYHSTSAQRRSHSERLRSSASRELQKRNYRMEKLFGQLVEPQYIAGRIGSDNSSQLQLQVNEETIDLVQLIVQHPEIYQESTARMTALSSFPFQLNSQQSSFCSSLLLVCPSLLKLRYRLQAEDAIFFRTLLVLLGNMQAKPRVVAAIRDAQLNDATDSHDDDDLFGNISSLTLQWQATVGTSTDDVTKRDSSCQAEFDCDWDAPVNASTQTDYAPTQQRVAATQTTVSYLQKRVTFDIGTSTRAEMHTQTHTNQGAQTKTVASKPTTAFGAFKSFLQRVERVLGEVKQPPIHNRTRSTTIEPAIKHVAPMPATRQRSASVDSADRAANKQSRKRTRANTMGSAPLTARRRFTTKVDDSTAHAAIQTSAKAIDDAFTVCSDIVRELIASMSDNKVAPESDSVAPTAVNGGEPAEADDADEFDESSALLYSSKHFGSSSAEYQPLIEMFYSADDSDSEEEQDDEVERHSTASVSEINIEVDFSDDDFEIIHNSQVDQRI